MRFKLIEGRLNEDIEAVRKMYPDIDDQTFNLLLNTDPTYNPDRNSVGKYTKWILNQYKKGNINIGKGSDGYLTAFNSNWEFEIFELLSRFNDAIKTKNINKDINSYKYPREIHSAIMNSDTKELSKRQQDRRARKAWKEADEVYEDDTWEIWIPETYNASCTLGSGTKWCTAAQSEQGKQMWSDYTGADEDGNIQDRDYQQGDLYVLFNKKTGEKYQFHFDTESYMDANDDPIDIYDFFAKNPEVYFFFATIFEDYGYNVLEGMRDVALASEGTTFVYPEDVIAVEAIPYVKNIVVSRSNDKPIEEIYEREFWDFTGLENVEIEEGITVIKQEAFIECSKLKVVNLPKSLEKVHVTAFPEGCTIYLYKDCPMFTVNGVSHEECVKAFADKGVSVQWK